MISIFLDLCWRQKVDDTILAHTVISPPTFKHSLQHINRNMQNQEVKPHSGHSLQHRVKTIKGSYSTAQRQTPEDSPSSWRLLFSVSPLSLFPSAAPLNLISQSTKTQSALFHFSFVTIPGVFLLRLTCLPLICYHFPLLSKEGRLRVRCKDVVCNGNR